MNRESKSAFFSELSGTSALDKYLAKETSSHGGRSIRPMIHPSPWEGHLDEEYLFKEKGRDRPRRKGASLQDARPRCDWTLHHPDMPSKGTIEQAPHHSRTGLLNRDRTPHLQGYFSTWPCLLSREPPPMIHSKLHESTRNNQRQLQLHPRPRSGP